MRNWTEYLTEQLRKSDVTQFEDEEDACARWEAREEPLTLRPLKGRPSEDQTDDCVQTRTFEAQGMFCELELIISRQILLDDDLSNARVFYSAGLIYESPWKYALVGFDITGDRAYLARAFELDLSDEKAIEDRKQKMFAQQDEYLSSFKKALNAKRTMDNLVREFLRLKYNQDSA